MNYRYNRLDRRRKKNLSRDIIGTTFWTFSSSNLILRASMRNVFRAGNFRMVDIESNDGSSLFLNLETNLVSWIVYEIQSIRVAYQMPGNLKFCAPFKIDIQKRKNWFLIFLYYIQKKSRLSKKLKVSTLDIRIKQSGLMVSHSKVPKSGNI